MDIKSTPYYALLLEGLEENRAERVERAQGFPTTPEEYLGLGLPERILMARDIMLSYSRSAGPEEKGLKKKTVTQCVDDHIEVKLSAKLRGPKYGFGGVIEPETIELYASAKDTQTDIVSGQRLGEIGIKGPTGHEIYVRLPEKDKYGTEHLGGKLKLWYREAACVVDTLDEVICGIITTEIARDHALGAVATASVTSE